MTEFQKGDTVRLKSGGPLMTVQNTGDFSPLGPEKGVVCVWFERSRPNEQTFDAAVLVKDSRDDTGGVAVATFRRD